MVQATHEAAPPPRAIDMARGNFSDAAGLKFAPYWWEAAPRTAKTGGFSRLPARTDVAIVGSGYTGLSAALTLARRGRSVVVLERDVPGIGASTRNGGQVGTGIQKLSLTKLAGLGSEDAVGELLREGIRILDHIEHVVTSEGIACQFRRCGRFRGAMRPEHYERMARDLEILGKLSGLQSYMVPRAELDTEVGTEIFHGGAVLPNDATIHPALYHEGLMKRALEAGVVIIGEAHVRAILAEGTDWRLTTDAGEIRARDVVVAANAHAGRIVAELNPCIVPVGSAMIATAPLPEPVFRRLLPKNRVYGNTARVFSYFRGAPEDTRIIFGGRVSRVFDGTSPRAYRHLARDMIRFFPELADVPVTHAWDGVIAMTNDNVPHIGRTRDGLYYALGYCGNAGISRATYFGHKVALKVLGDPDGRTAFDDLRFPAFPFHFMARPMVPVVEAWMSLRDRFD